MPTMLERWLFQCLYKRTQHIETHDCGFNRLHKSRCHRPSFGNTVRYGLNRTLPISPSKQQVLIAQSQWTCHRGLPIWFRDVHHRRKCLCPPSYYSDQGQYQNQRVGVAVRIDRGGTWQAVFGLVVMLIDGHGLIESHDHIFYVPSIDCNLLKFNLYLLYRACPKNAAGNYSVQFHTYNKEALNYRGSYLFPLRLSFSAVQVW